MFIKFNLKLKRKQNVNNTLRLEVFISSPSVEVAPSRNRRQSNTISKELAGDDCSVNSHSIALSRIYLFYPISSLFSLARPHAPSISNYFQLFKVLCFLTPCFCHLLYQTYLPHSRLLSKSPWVVKTQFRGDVTVKAFWPVHVKWASILFCFVPTKSCTDIHYWSCNTLNYLFVYKSVSFPRLEVSWKQRLFTIALSFPNSSTVHKSQLFFKNFW